jgi:hypothetical protein
LRRATQDDASWAWDADQDGPIVTAWNEEQRLYFLVASKRLKIVTELPEPSSLELAARTVLPDFLTTLHLDKLEGCGAGGTWTLAAPDSHAAAEGFERWLFSARLRSKLEALGGRPDDLILSLRFDNADEVTTYLRAEPATDRYAAEGPFFVTGQVEDYPPASLIASIDRDQQSPLSGEAALDRARHHLEQVLNQAERALATVGFLDDAD